MAFLYQHQGYSIKLLKKAKVNHPLVKIKLLHTIQVSFLDGTVFDSSHDRGEPATFPVSGVIKGWQEALPMMKEGGKWQIVVPANLAYGDRGCG